MAYPEGYRKAMRLMELADARVPARQPLDIPGAYPGVAAEQHGQGGAIARSQARHVPPRRADRRLRHRRGGLGRRDRDGLADRVLMQENAIYTVISPEGCAAILWRDAGEKKAAAAFKPDAVHCLELGVIDGIVAEPEAGAHTDPDAAARLLGDASERRSTSSTASRGDELRRNAAPIPRARRFRPSQRRRLWRTESSRRGFRQVFGPACPGASPQHPQGYPRLRNDFGPAITGPRVDPPLGGEALRDV